MYKLVDEFRYFQSTLGKDLFLPYLHPSPPGLLTKHNLRNQQRPRVPEAIILESVCLSEFQ